MAAVRRGLADGTLDAIATDHAPHGILDKHVPFADAANGVIGLETALPLTLALVRAGVLTPARAVELLSSSPAAVFDLPGGHLSPGAPADVTVVDPSAEWTLDPQRLQSKSRNTPYAGMEMVGRVVHTFVGGRPVWFDGALGKETDLKRAMLALGGRDWCSRARPSEQPESALARWCSTPRCPATRRF